MKKSNIINKELPTAKGVHTFILCDVISPEAQKIQAKIVRCSHTRQWLIESGKATQEALKKQWFEYRALIRELHAKFKVREYVVENITTTIGRSAITQRLSGDTTYTGIVNYTVLGDDSTTPAVGDATLGNEVYRKVLSSGTFDDNIAYLETFFTASEIVDTLEEYGMVIDGSAGVDTGQLFNRFTQQTIKSNTETLNIQSIITLNDA